MRVLGSAAGRLPVGEQEGLGDFGLPSLWVTRRALAARSFRQRRPNDSAGARFLNESHDTEIRGVRTGLELQLELLFKALPFFKLADFGETFDDGDVR